jgi:phosphate transport system substrate-binding protein
MKRHALLGAILFAGLSGFVLLGCSEKKDGPAKKEGDKPTAAEGAEVKLDGSSTVYPVAQAAADEFVQKNKGAKVTVGVSGTGGGFKKFCKGETDVSDASRPILKKEIEEAGKNNVEYVELPIAFDALTVVVSSKNDWADFMTTDELKTMWSKASQGKVTKWSGVRKGWPDEPFKLFGPGTDSGTYDYFTEAINGKSGDSRSDYSASEDDNTLVRGVAGDKYALGYFGYSYYENHKDKLKAVKIKGPKNKEPVEPGDEGIKNGTYTPLSRPLFIYVNKKSAQRPEVDRFVTFFLTNAGALSRRKAYVALPKEAYTAVRTRYKDRKTGTAFGGVPEVGLSIDELLKREVK